MSQVAKSGNQPDPGRWPVGNNVDVHVGQRRDRGRAGPAGISGAALMLSVIFIVLLITNPQQLDAAWQWIRDLPIVLEVFAWMMLLPWMLAYLAWNASWDLWLRLVVVAILIGSFAMDFWRPRNT